MEAFSVSNQCPPIPYIWIQEEKGTGYPYETNREAIISLRSENLKF